ncbi:MAG: PH domain-containing protein [Clostridia bacterium]
MYEIKKSYNFIYELFSKRGYNLRKFIVALFTFIFIFFIYNIYKNDIKISTSFIPLILYGLIGINSIVILFSVLLKFIQYRSTAYRFYDTHMEYEDSFLNKEKTTLSYINIKEMELKRNVFDRIMNYGTISIYTNAEKSEDQGIILESIKRPQEVYDNIDKIVHKTNNEKIDNEKVDNEKDFLDDIKN